MTWQERYDLRYQQIGSTHMSAVLEAKAFADSTMLDDIHQMLELLCTRSAPDAIVGAIAAEREACAKIADVFAGSLVGSSIAENIRNRSERDRDGSEHGRALATAVGIQALIGHLTEGLDPGDVIEGTSPDGKLSWLIQRAKPGGR